MAAVTSDEHIRFQFKGKDYLVPTHFIVHEHPGGKKIVMKYKEKDITQAFEDAEHSTDALEMLEEWLEDAPKPYKEAMEVRAKQRQEEHDEWRWRSTAIAFGVATIVAAWVFRKH